MPEFICAPVGQMRERAATDPVRQAIELHRLGKARPSPVAVGLEEIASDHIIRPSLWAEQERQHGPGMQGKRLDVGISAGCGEQIPDQFVVRQLGAQ